MKKITIHDKTFHLSIPSKEIQKRVGELGKQITEELKDQSPVFIICLKGAFFFAADLLKNISIECEITFIRVSSYKGTLSTGIKNHFGINDELKGKNVVLLEDIIDTGTTAIYLVDEIKKHHPNSLRICTLLVKPQTLKHDLVLDYVGFTLSDKFIVGYGLDYDGLGRNLQDIYQLPSS